MLEECCNTRNGKIYIKCTNALEVLNPSILALSHRTGWTMYKHDGNYNN